MFKKQIFKKSKTVQVALITCISAAMLIFVALLTSCNSTKTIENLKPYVNVFAGNSTVGHTSPCATTPFGMIKVGPESGNIG